MVGKQSRFGRKQGAKVLFCAVNAVTGHPAGSVAVHPVVNSSRPSAGIVDIASITESCISVAPPVLPSRDDVSTKRVRHDVLQRLIATTASRPQVSVRRIDSRLGAPPGHQPRVLRKGHDRHGGRRAGCARRPDVAAPRGGDEGGGSAAATPSSVRPLVLLVPIGAYSLRGRALASSLGGRGVAATHTSVPASGLTIANFQTARSAAAGDLPIEA